MLSSELGKAGEEFSLRIVFAFDKSPHALADVGKASLKDVTGAGKGKSAEAGIGLWALRKRPRRGTKALGVGGKTRWGGSDTPRTWCGRAEGLDCILRHGQCRFTPDKVWVGHEGYRPPYCDATV